MAFAFQFLKALQPAEIGLITELPMQDREREVFDLMCRTDKRIFPSRTIAKQLGLNASHLDKINSVLLKKSLETVAGKNIYEQINYLASKTGMWNLSKHLLKAYELKQLNEEGSDEDKLKYYRFCLEWIIGIPFSYQDSNLINNYVERINLYTRSENREETNLWIEVTLLRRDINIGVSRTSIFIDPDKTLFHKKFEDIASKVNSHRHIQLQFRLLLSKSAFHNLYEEFDHSREQLSMAKNILDEFPMVFGEHDIFLFDWHHAQILYHTSCFEESREHYKTLAENLPPAPKAKWFMLLAEYYQVCLITGDLITAEKLLNDYFINYTDDINGSIFISACLQAVKYYLYTDNFTKANSFVIKLRQSMQKTTFFQLQVALKELSLAHSYLSGDMDLSFRMANQNLKFLRSKKIHETIPYFTFHSRLIKPISKHKNSGQELNPAELHMLTEMQKGTRAQYGILLKKWMLK